MNENNPTYRGDINYPNYPNTRNDGEVSNNKTYSVDTDGNLVYKELPVSLPPTIAPIEKTVSFQLDISQNNKHIICTGVANKIITVPLESTESLPNGFKVIVTQEDAGTVTFVGEGGVVIFKNVTKSLVIKGENNAISLIKESNEEWGIYGALTVI